MRMTSPFDCKNKAAAWLDRMALHVLLFLLCVGYFFFLWRSGVLSLFAGSALFLLVMLSILLIEKQTLSRRDRLLRERVGGAIALSELLLMPSMAACTSIRDLLCQTLDATPEEKNQMRYSGETWLIRCAQCMQDSSTSEGEILSAHRARIESGCDKCALISTSRFSPAAIRAAEWMDPPVRLISGRQLSQLYGRLYPATDEAIARHLSRQRKPFSFERIRALALSPAKLSRHLLCAFLLLLLYLMTGHSASLIAALISFSLSILCARENRRAFRL